MQQTIDIEQFIDENGNVHYGNLIRFWRKKVRGWTHAQTIVDLYNELLADGEAPMSVRWWQRMEQMNEVPRDEKRRRLIQVLLNIPPAYLGLTTLESVDFVQRMLVHAEPVISTGNALDFREYEKNLAYVWRSSYIKQDKCIAELQARVTHLEHMVLYGKTQNRVQSRRLLCHYLCAYGNAYRYLGYMSQALHVLDKAILLAYEYQMEDLRVKALYLRSFTLFNRWTQYQHPHDRVDLQEANNSFQEAYQVLGQKDISISLSLKCAILADGGRAAACIGRDRQERVKAIHRIDQAGQILSAATFQPDPCFLSIDKDWYFIDKAEAFLASGWFDAGLEEIAQVCDGDPHAQQRYLYTNLIEAEGYIARGWIDGGILSLEDALQALTETTSRRHLARMLRISGQLQTDERYKNVPAVARFHARLVKAQYPHSI